MITGNRETLKMGLGEADEPLRARGLARKPWGHAPSSATGESWNIARSRSV